MTLLEFAATRVEGQASKGVHSSPTNKELIADAIICQAGACWVCGEHLDGSAELDRLATGRALGFDCRCADHCRCGYLPGNVAAAHRSCHAGADPIRERLAPADVVTLARRFVPTFDAMAAARLERRATRGTREAPEAARRLASARARVGAA